MIFYNSMIIRYYDNTLEVNLELELSLYDSWNVTKISVLSFVCGVSVISVNLLVVFISCALGNK